MVGVYGVLTYTEQRTHGANLGGKLAGVYRPDPEMDDRTRLMLIEAYGGTNLGAVLLSLLVIF